MTALPNRSAAIAYRPTALVAGGAGFLGSFLCQSLLYQGCRVLVFDNLVTGRRENLAPCFDSPNFQFFNQDLTAPLPEVGEIKYIFHLAGMEGYPDLSLKRLLVNSEGTKNLIKLAQVKKAKFLLCSSVESFLTPLSHSWKNLGSQKDFASSDEARQFAEQLVAAYLKEGLDARIVRLGWVYGPRMNLDSGGELTRILHDAFLGVPLSLPGDGSRQIFPVFLSDAVYGLTKALFTAQTKGRTFTLVGDSGISFSDLAQKLKKITGRPLPLNFVPAKEGEFKPDETVRREQKLLGWQTKISLEEGLARTFSFFSSLKPASSEPAAVSEEIPPSLPPVKPVPFKLPSLSPLPLLKTPASLFKKPLFLKSAFSFKKKKSFSWLRDLGRGVAVFCGLILLLLLPFAPLLLQAGWGAWNLNQAWKSFQAGEVKSFKIQSYRALNGFEKAGGEIGRWSGVLAKLNLTSEKNNLLSEAWLAKRITRIGWYAAQLGEKFDALGGVVFREEEGNLAQLTTDSQTLLQALWEEISFIEAEIKLRPDLMLSSSLVNRVLPMRELLSDLSQSKKLILEAKGLLSVLPQILGAEQKKTYLVLLQNNMELRPTGGFIGSFALTVFDNGRLSAFEVFDVYTADGQLKGHVEPPEPIKKYLGEGGWYLRDSNWSPDFPTSAVRAAWFLEKTLSREVDGVIGVNLDLAQAVLAAVGEVELSDFQEKINAENLFSKAEFYAEVNFFPGSTQKKDFLGSLAKALLSRVKSLSLPQEVRLSQGLYSSLAQKDLLFYFKEPAAMEMVANFGWEGSLRQAACSEKCLPDYLMVVEANLGVNKSNAYLKRDLDLASEISGEGVIRHRLTINYLNGSPQESQFGGNYKNYLRLFVPLGSQVKSIQVGDQVLASNQFETSASAGKTAFGFLVEVGVGAEKKVVVEYEPPLRLKEGQTDYLLLWQKQPGAEASPLRFSLKFPPKTSVLKINPAPTAVGEQVKFTKTLSRDLLFNLQLKTAGN